MPWGCPTLPMDVVMDETAHKSLTKLRSLLETGEEGGGGSGGDEEKKEERKQESTTSVNAMTEEEALDNLFPSGDTNKSTLTLVGNKGGGSPEEQINQDRAMIYSPFFIQGQGRQQQGGSKDSTSDDSNFKIQLLGVFDGHGDTGELTSQHAVSTLPKLLSEKLGKLPSLRDNEEGVSKVLNDVFVEIDKSDPSHGESGCTASIVLQLHNKIYVANSGDSVSFIAALIDGQQVDIAYQSREDKPDLPDEKQRIQSMGGYVHIPGEDEDDVPRAYYVDEDGMARYGLAMSRSLGDWNVQVSTYVCFFFYLFRILVSNYVLRHVRLTTFCCCFSFFFLPPSCQLHTGCYCGTYY